MKLTASRWTAAVSALVALGALEAARRPRYGGELRVEMHAAPRSVEPGEAPRFLEGQIFETLVRLDDRGEPQPWLATSWTHEPERKRWVFAARSNVALHNGTVWSPAGGVVTAPDGLPIEQILRDMARPRNAVMVRGADGTLLGTGPFRLVRWDAEKSATLAAHDGYWGGRPFLDTVEIQMGRAMGDQALDLEVGKADVVEIAASGIRRLRQRGVNVIASELVETIALAFENGRATDAVREAVALSIDRAAIHNVLLQKQGEISGALLPRWLSGYSFLFSTERSVARARQLAGAATLTFAYDRQDATMRAIGERISVNASEAGITLRPGTTSADVRLVRLPITSLDALSALEDLAAMLKSPLPPGGNPYEVERALLDGHRVIPLVHLPEAWAAGSRVKNWPRLADAWLDARDKP